MRVNGADVDPDLRSSPKIDDALALLDALPFGDFLDALALAERVGTSANYLSRFMRADWRFNARRVMHPTGRQYLYGSPASAAWYGDSANHYRDPGDAEREAFLVRFDRAAHLARFRPSRPAFAGGAA